MLLAADKPTNGRYQEGWLCPVALSMLVNRAAAATEANSLSFDVNTNFTNQSCKTTGGYISMNTGSIGVNWGKIRWRYKTEHR